MHILIATSNNDDLISLKEQLACPSDLDIINFKHLTIQFLETRYSTFETAYHLGLALKKKRYNLVLFAGLCNSLNTYMKTGEVLNVINDNEYDLGIQTNDLFENSYTLNWRNKSDFPHVRGSYINMTNAYFNVFLPYTKAAAITLNTLQGNKETIEKKMAQYPMHIETTNGAAVQFTCLHQRVPFYHLRAVELNMADGTQDKKLAIKNLNQSLFTIIDLL